MINRHFVHAYVDETGDRGNGPRASRFFALAALVVAQEDEPLVRHTIKECRDALDIPSEREIHWVKDCKTFERRQHVSSCLSAVPRVLVNYVVFDKHKLSESAHIRNNQVAFYNYAAGIIMERVLFTAQEWEHGSRDLLVNFGHVRGFKHEETKRYFEKKAKQGYTSVPWSLNKGVSWHHMDKYLELQAADLYAGILHAALHQNKFGQYQNHHLMQIRHQIRRVNGTAWGYGFKALTGGDELKGLPWWPQEGI